MQSTTTESTAAHSQWLFPISALACTPTAQERSLHEEMYDRSRGIEFLYRLGTSIGLFVCLSFYPPPPRSTLISSQPFTGTLHCRDVVPSFLYAVFYGRLSPPSQSLCATSRLVPYPVTNTSLDHRGRLHISRYEDRRVRKEAQGRSQGMPVQGKGNRCP
jgi:hypothetical protein